MPGFRSLSARFTAAVVVAGTAAFLANSGLVVSQLKHALDRQGAELVRLSDGRVATQLGSNARLAAARLEFQQADIGRRLAAIGDRADMRAAIASGNVVAMSELLLPAAVNADIDQILVVDAEMSPLGGHSGRTDFIATATRLLSTDLGADIRRVLTTSNAGARHTLNTKLAADDTLRETFALSPQTAYLQLLVQPIYGEFGDSVGALIGLRALKPLEPILADFVEKSGNAVAVFLGDEPISFAGLDAPPHLTGASEGSALLRSTDGRMVAGCTSDYGALRVCALAPVEELYVSRDELLRIGTAEGETLRQWMVGVGLGSILLFALLAIVLTRQVAVPLKAIRSALSALAAGNYRMAVGGRERTDEVGEIARAVVSLQDSVRERDELRVDAVRQNQRLQTKETELRKQNLLFDAALNNMSHGLCMFDAAGRLIVSNRRFGELYDLGSGPLTQEQIVLAGRGAREDGARAGAECDGQVHTSGSDRLQRLADGRMIEVSRQPLPDGGSVEIYEDVTERLRQEAQVIHMASHDALTGLPNRMLLRRRIDGELVRMAADGRTFAVIYLDLDEFKTVNDTLGHPFGDALLRQVADRLVAQRRGDDLIVRLGGDEFAIVFTDFEHLGDVTDYAAAVIRTLSRPYMVEEHEAVVGASVGIAIATSTGCNTDELLKQADLALYCAKAAGKGSYRLFEAQMEADIRNRRDLLVDLHLALERGEFEPFFQPQVDLATGAIVGFEALLRWRHPVRGLISPLDFIPLAEETGLIDAIGAWVLRRSCEIASAWPAHLRIAVNVSARQLRSTGFDVAVASTLADTRLEPRRLELEITESALLDVSPDTHATLLRIKDLGVRISMDDFGTGYSSLSVLRSFPFDKIKVDRSFVQAMGESAEARAIVVAILQLARTLGMATTAEGIETEELAILLAEEGCQEAQGYLFGAPQPAVIATGLVESFVRRPAVGSAAAGAAAAARRSAVG